MTVRLIHLPLDKNNLLPTPLPPYIAPIIKLQTLKSYLMKTLIIAILTFSTSLIIAQNTVTWVGGTPGNETSWEEPKNWSDNKVPNENSVVIIKDFNSGHNAQPVITENGGQLDANANGVTHRWYLNGEPISGSSAQIPVQGSGAYTVEVTDNNGCSEVQVFTVDGNLSVEDLAISTLKVYPNPAADFVNIDLANAGAYNMVSLQLKVMLL